MNKNDVLELMQQFQASDLSRLEYDWGQGHVIFARGSQSPTGQSVPGGSQSPTGQTESAPAAPIAPASATTSAGATASQPDLASQPAPETQPDPASQSDLTDAKAPAEVKAPLVGMFYRAAAPGEKAFVGVGDVVEEGQVLCILEAMKVMNEITAPYDCKILRIAVADGEMVEYGTVLFEVEPC